MDLVQLVHKRFMAKTTIQKGSNPMLDKAIGWIRSLTEAGLALIALGVVLQILFGAAVPFIGLDIIGSVVGLVGKLGAEGLVGLVAVCVLWGIYTKK